MVNVPWSLESELCGLSGAASMSAALCRLGLHHGDQGDCLVETVSDWARSGAETYSLIFAIRNAQGEDRQFRLKACVAFSLKGNIEGILASWISRRELLSSYGVSTPILYGSGSGVLVEEEIPFDIQTVLSSDGADVVLGELVNLASTIARLGFSPLNLFSGVKSRGRDAVLVDFGRDLGNPYSESSSEIEIVDRLISQLGDWNYYIGLEKELELRRAFNHRVSAAV